MTVDLRKKLEHPVIASLATIAVVASGLTGTAQITGWYDAQHTSQAELQVVDDKVDRNTALAKCSRLDIKISLVENAIWQMEQSSQNSQRLVEKRRELKKLEEQYRELKCAIILQ